MHVIVDSLSDSNNNIKIKLANLANWTESNWINHCALTHLSLWRDTLHRDSPSLRRGNSSTTLWKHRLQSPWSIPSSPTRLLGHGHLGSSSRSECLYTHTHTTALRHTGVCLVVVSKMSSVISRLHELLSLTYTAHPSGVEFEVWRAVAVVASRDVDAYSINTDCRVCTLVNVWGRRTKQRFFISTNICSQHPFERSGAFPSEFAVAPFLLYS